MARRAAKRIEEQAASHTVPASDPAQQFLRLMSHEMRTPLNGVIGMINLLQRTRLDGAQRAYAENARQSACIAAALANAAPQAEQAIAQAQGGTQLALLMIPAAR